MPDRIEYVQVRAAGVERPVHALAVLLDDDPTNPEPYDLDARTVCDRLGHEEMDRPYPPFDPFVNTPAEHRCAICDYGLAQRLAGLPVGITRFQ